MLSRPAILTVGALVSYMVATGTAVMLVSGGSINSPFGLEITYAVYACAIIAAVHFCTFGFPQWFEIPLSKRLPKYLEYAYIVVIAASLLDVINFAPRYYSYLTYTGPNEATLLDQISGMAAAQIASNCGKGPQHASAFRVDVYSDFTPDYCRKLQALAASRGRREAVFAAARDETFLHYVISRTVVRPPGDETPQMTEQSNPIAGLIASAVRLETFEHYSQTDKFEVVWKWFSLLLLPLGIGLRALKTSLELFGDLK